MTGGALPVFIRGPDGDPGSPSRPAPLVQMGAAPHPGPTGPQPPRRPLPPAPTQNGLLYSFGAPPPKLQGGQVPTKPCVLRKCGVSPGAGTSARFRSRWEVGGDTPPHHPPDLSRGAEAASLSVGARLRPSAGSAPSPALRRLRRSAPGAAPPLAGSATAPPSIWYGACAPEAAEPSARPPSHTPL